MFLLANDLEKTSHFLENAGLYPTLAAVSVAVFVLAYLIRAVENYVRHLYRKPYLAYAHPRYVLSTIGYILVADGFVIGGVFQERLPLHTATVTVSAGLLCLIASAVMSALAMRRRAFQIRHDGAGRTPENDDETSRTGGGADAGDPGR